jgi:hypothetical protein
MRGWLNIPVSVEFPSPGSIQSELGQRKGSIPNKTLCGWYSGVSGGNFFVAVCSGHACVGLDAPRRPFGRSSRSLAPTWRPQALFGVV